jgi:hypothetical protein
MDRRDSKFVTNVVKDATATAAKETKEAPKATTTAS